MFGRLLWVGAVVGLVIGVVAGAAAQLLNAARLHAAREAWPQLGLTPMRLLLVPLPASGASLLTARSEVTARASECPPGREGARDTSPLRRDPCVCAR